MVDLHLRDGHLEVEVRGLHKLWALRSRLQVPLASVVAARRLRPEAAAGLWKGWRVPGTHVPGVIVAGTYYKSGEKHFWDVRDTARAIEIELSGADFSRLYLEVEDPEAALELLGAPERC